MAQHRMTKKWGFCKYTDYFGNVHEKMFSYDEWCCAMVVGEVIFESDNYAEVDEFRNNYKN